MKKTLLTLMIAFSFVLFCINTFAHAVRPRHFEFTGQGGDEATLPAPTPARDQNYPRHPSHPLQMTHVVQPRKDPLAFVQRNRRHRRGRHKEEHVLPGRQPQKMTDHRADHSPVRYRQHPLLTRPC